MAVHEIEEALRVVKGCECVRVRGACSGYFPGVLVILVAPCVAVYTGLP